MSPQQTSSPHVTWVWGNGHSVCPVSTVLLNSQPSPSDAHQIKAFLLLCRSPYHTPSYLRHQMGTRRCKASQFLSRSLGVFPSICASAKWCIAHTITQSPANSYISCPAPASHHICPRAIQHIYIPHPIGHVAVIYDYGRGRKHG